MSAQTLLSPSFLYTLDRLELVSRRARVGAFKGERRSPRRGGSVEFADFREYAPGDDFRQIDWNAYARLERLFLRLFIEEQDATVHVLLDASHSMHWGNPSKWDYARRVAAAMGYIALIGMDRLVGAALAAIQTLYAENQALESRVTSLEARLAALEARASGNTTSAATGRLPPFT